MIIKTKGSNFFRKNIKRVYEMFPYGCPSQIEPQYN